MPIRRSANIALCAPPAGSPRPSRCRRDSLQAPCRCGITAEPSHFYPDLSNSYLLPTMRLGSLFTFIELQVCNFSREKPTVVIELGGRGFTSVVTAGKMIYRLEYADLPAMDQILTPFRSWRLVTIQIGAGAVFHTLPIGDHRRLYGERRTQEKTRWTREQSSFWWLGPRSGT